MWRTFTFLFAWMFVPAILAQHAFVQPAVPITLPGTSDSNSPVHWSLGRVRVFQSMGMSIRNEADSLDGPWETTAVTFGEVHTPWWIESTWHDEQSGALFGWYHFEDHSVCENGLAMPSVGAMLSWDDGLTFVDLGLVLTSSDPPNCEAANGYFAGGHGDFTVMADPKREYFYFFFGHYGGPAERQGVAVARMPFVARWTPAGQAVKYFEGEWNEPGLEGRVTPIFPVAVPWEDLGTDAFWGPAVHWNRHLNRYVMLLNRACCEPGWPQEGIYISYNADLSDPAGWSAPEKILAGIGWYPQVVGLEPGDTDKEAGARARLFVAGVSEFDIEFSMTEETSSAKSTR